MSSADPDLSIDTRRHFLQALRRVVRPIVRLMIRAGIRYDEFVDVARGAYVESAIRDGIGDLKFPTRDQIAYATGIAPERVAHYIETNQVLPAADALSSSLMSEVLHKWYTDPQYQGPSGEPLEIEIDARSGPSFNHLVAQLDANASPERVLEELLRGGAITHSGEQRIRVVMRCFIWPKGGFPLFEYFGVTLAHLIETHEHNLSSSDAEKKRLERSVFAERGLSKQLVPSFQVFAKDRADQFLSSLDDWLAGQTTSVGKQQSGPRIEAGVNVFFYVESPRDVADLRARVQHKRSVPRTNESLES